MITNWKVRIRNKTFWCAFIPAVLLVAQTLAAAFGATLNLGGLSSRLLAIVDAVFSLLAVLGVVNDPTTAGYADSAQAMTYEKPKQSR